MQAHPLSFRAGDAFVTETRALAEQAGLKSSDYIREAVREKNERMMAERIADLVVAQQDMHSRVIELQPVADRVPMLQAAVEETEANLSERERELGNMRQDIDAIASRPVTGPVFRLLTRGGRLRR